MNETKKVSPAYLPSASSGSFVLILLSHLGPQVLSHVSVFSPTEPPCSRRLLQGLVRCASTARPHQISQCSWARHKRIRWRTTLGGSGLPAVLRSQDRIFLSGKASAEEPISRGCLAPRIPEETPVPGGEKGARLLEMYFTEITQHIAAFRACVIHDKGCHMSRLEAKSRDHIN